MLSPGAIPQSTRQDKTRHAGLPREFIETARSAHELAERLREQMEQSVVHLDQGDVTFTVSFGVVQMAPECASIEALVAMADAAMYKAKQKGKNSVFVAEPAEPKDAAR